MDLQANELLINPVSIWSNGQTTSVSVIRFDVFGGYHFGIGDAHVRYVLCAVVNNTLVDVFGGMVNIPVDVVNAWTTDDNVIYNYVLSQLNLSKQ